MLRMTNETARLREQHCAAVSANHCPVSFETMRRVELRAGTPDIADFIRNRSGRYCNTRETAKAQSAGMQRLTRNLKEMSI
jgi:hypothetical protein